MNVNGRGPLLWPTAAEQFFADSASNVSSPASVRTWGVVYRQLQALHPDKRLAEFGEDDLVGFLNQAAQPAGGARWSNNTKLTYRKALVAMWSWALYTGRLKRDVSIGLHRRVRPKATRVRKGNWLSTGSQLSALFRAVEGLDPLSARDRIVLNLGLFTGLRASELVGLRWNHVDLENRRITVFGKGGTLAEVHIPEQLLEELFAWCGLYSLGLGAPVEDEPVLVPASSCGGGCTGTPAATALHWGKALSYQTVLEAVKRRGAMAGLPQLRPHDLRRTFAGLLEEWNMPLLDISKALRHSNVGTTNAYLRDNPARLADTMRNFRIAL